MDERTLLVIESEGGTSVRNEKKMGKGCPLCPEECALHSNSSAVIQARRGEEGGQQQVRFEGRGQAREGEEQAGGQNAPEIDHMGHARSGKEREVENSAPLSLPPLKGWAKNGPQVW